MELGYWALRGRGEPIRLLLRYKGVEFKDATIPLTEEGMGKWFGELKENLDLDFPNLPYLIDGDVRLTESLAIMRYLGRKYDMIPDDMAKGDMVELVIQGQRNDLFKISDTADFENLKEGGRGEPIRLLLRYKGVEFKDATIPLTEEGMGKWFGELKENLDLDFPNLPYLIDGDVRLTESLAIMRYLGRKYDMIPDDMAKGDMVELVIQGQRNDLFKISDSADFENLKEGFITKLKVFLERFAKFVVKPFIFGDKVTYIDIWAYENLDHIRAMTPESFTGEYTKSIQRVHILDVSNFYSLLQFTTIENLSIVTLFPNPLAWRWRCGMVWCFGCQH
eukprot:sb/3466567/